MEYHPVIAKIKQANAGQGDHFFLVDGHDIDFSFLPTIHYPPNSIVAYQGDFYLRTMRLVGYGPGVLPTDTNFFTPAAGRLDAAALDSKLTAAYVTAFPASPQEGVMYINTATGVTQAFKGGVYVPIGQPPTTAGDPYNFEIPVPIMMGFNADLDTPHHTRLYFAGSIKGITWHIDPAMVSATSFTAYLLNGSLRTTFTSTSALQVWIDDHTTATTGFYVEVAITPTPTATGEITGVFTHRKTISVPTVHTISQGTGYGVYRDTQYSQAAPFRLLAGIETVLPNNAGNKDESQLPGDTVSFYNPATQRITPTNIGDGYAYAFIFKAIPTVANAKLDFGIDIGGTLGKIFNPNYTVAVNAGQVDSVFIGIPASYSGPTFTPNGGQVKITASADVDVWGMIYQVSRTHKAR